MNKLIELMDESAKIYKNFLELEYKKYDAVIKNDIELLEEIVAQEQAFYMKMRGIEQKREKLLDFMGFKDKSFKEVIESVEGNEKDTLIEKYDEFSKTIAEVKKIVNLCKTLIEVRMHRINKAMEQLGEKDNTYSLSENKNNSKSMLFSKKI